MYELKVPKVLKKGDTIALISLSGGERGMRICAIDMKPAKSDWKKYGEFM